MLEDRQGKCLSVLAKYLLREFSIAQEKVWGGGTELNGFMVLEWLKFMELFLLIQLLFTKAGVDTNVSFWIVLSTRNPSRQSDLVQEVDVSLWALDTWCLLRWPTHIHKTHYVV